MIKAIVTARVEKLLNELEEISKRVADMTIEKQNSTSVIQKADAGHIPPKDLKRIFSIQNQLQMLSIIFNKEK